MKAWLAPLLLLLGACGSTPPATEQDKPGKWTRWNCADASWRFSDTSRERIDLRLAGSDVIHRLRQSGGFYSEAGIVFDDRDVETANGPLGRGCLAP